MVMLGSKNAAKMYWRIDNKDADYTHDLKMMRPHKRGSVASDNVDFEDNCIDKDCGIFINCLKKNCDRTVDGDTNFEAQCVSEDDCVDPQYKMLLEIVKVDEKSYLLKVVENDVFSVIEYEKDELRNDLLKSITSRKKLKSFPKRKNTEGENCVGERETKGPVRLTESPNFNDNVEFKDYTVDKDYDEIFRKGARKCDSRNVHPQSMGNGDGDDNSVTQCMYQNEVADPQYKMFVENLRVDEKSYVLEVMVNGKSKVIKYEKEDGSRDGLKSKRSLKVLKNSQNRKGIESEICVDNRKIKRPGLLNQKERKKIETPKNAKRNEKGSEMGGNADIELGDFYSCSKNRHSSKRPLPECSNEREFDVMEESYRVYLNSLESDGIVLKSTDKSKYEDMETSSDSDIIATDYDPYRDAKYTPFVTRIVKSSIDLDNIRSSSTRKDSQFREKLMDILKRPYDPKEYEELLQEVLHQRPMEAERRLRYGKEIPYSLVSLSKSYLDSHTDLRSKINKVRSDHPKVLNLLRGFFYWLKNLTHEESFVPWLDSSCLNVLPIDCLVKEHIMCS